MTAAHEILSAIRSLPADWHKSGSLGAEALQAIAELCSQRAPLRHTLETGAGKSTLLFSHLSAHHLVFTLDRGSSLSQVLKSPLLNRERIEVVEGPTQRTLPAYRFGHRLQVALIDGPHAYPFPDLEYFFIYPQLETGGLLIIDDIDIPSIRRMVGFLRKDDMFQLLRIAGRCAIFERTAAETFDPFGDGWARQGFNAAHKRRKAWMLSVQRRLPAMPWAEPLVQFLRRFV
jgi:hypothetical protein